MGLGQKHFNEDDFATFKNAILTFTKSGDNELDSDANNNKETIATISPSS